jgi:serine/threonine protein phosphatase PrpC
LDAKVGTPAQVESQLTAIVAMLEQAAHAMAMAQRELPAEAMTQGATPATTEAEHGFGASANTADVGDGEFAEAQPAFTSPSSELAGGVSTVDRGPVSSATVEASTGPQARAPTSSDVAGEDGLKDRSRTMATVVATLVGETAGVDVLPVATRHDVTAPTPTAAPSSPSMPRPIPSTSQALRGVGPSPAVVHPADRSPAFTPLTPSRSAGGQDVAEVIHLRQAISPRLATKAVDDHGPNTSSVPPSAPASRPAVAPARTPYGPAAGTPANAPARAAVSATAQKLAGSTATGADAAPPTRRVAEVRLPNANAGRPYDTDVVACLPVGIRARIIPPLPEGLRMEPSGRLVGTPEQAGEYRIRWEQGEDGSSGALLLTVNADPRALWQDKPSDRTDRYWKPDTDRASRESTVARAIVASVRGRSHAHVGSFRDDDFALHFPTEAEGPHGWHVLVVADGAGSAKYSRRGSQLACEVVTKHLVETLQAPKGQDVAELVERSLHATEQDKSDSGFWSPRLYNTLVPAVAKAQSVVGAEAAAMGAAKKDFHTTLLLAVIRRTTAGAWFVGTYWIGDGAIGMWDDNWTAPKVFGETDSGEFAGETTFLTHEDFNKTDVVNRRLRYSIVPSFSYLALMTDGISDAKFDAETKLKSPDVWRAFTADLSTATEGMPLADMSDAQLLEWMQFWSQGNHDDRTLLLFHPHVDAGTEA